MPLSIHARPLVPEDREACERFDCGDAHYELEVSEFLRETYWRGGRPATEQTIVVVTVDTGELVGFGTWKLRDDLRVRGEDFGRRVIDIPFFGLDRRFQGETDTEGHKLAGRLFATLDAIARRTDGVEDGTPMHLVVDVDNVRGQRFWTGRGFAEIESLEFPSASYLRMIRA